MIQGETISTFIHDLPIPVSEVKDVAITFHTLTKTLLSKTLEDCRIEGEVIECKISQEESLGFTCGPVVRSVIILTSDGSRFELADETMIVCKTSRNEVIA